MQSPTSDSISQGTKRPRTRNGCLNCKIKKRKCDEAKPICSRCRNKGERCEWGSRLTFRTENNLGLQSVHKSSHERRLSIRKPARFKIKDVTEEVIRDYHQRESSGDVSPRADVHSTILSPSGTEDSQRPIPRTSVVWSINDAFYSDAAPVGIQQQILSTNGTGPANTTVELPTSMDLVDDCWHSPFATGFIDDSLFLPGSAFLDAHSTFRNHLIQEVRSNDPTREATPNTYIEPAAPPTWAEDSFVTAPRRRSIQISQAWAEADTHSDSARQLPASTLELSDEEEFRLWKNWSDEVAPWLDKFDCDRHFQHTLPVIARAHDHLRYSILAVSARQLERKEQSKHTERSLSLYQAAIQCVLPQLHTRSTPVIASCVVLCVLEMLSSSPKAWHQHLDGCANLIQAVGIHGFSGGVDQALFWCFARMDFCGGLIASSQTLIPVHKWVGGAALDTDIGIFTAHAGFNTHACQAVYLCAQILDLLALRPQLADRVGSVPHMSPEASETYKARWIALWQHVTAWYTNRPAEMIPVISLNIESKPFPMVLYSNPAAISGNQLYHTASMLMLRHKPHHYEINPKPRSIFWHARQICAISMSNEHHGAWTNSVQPLWIAGQWMSHGSEQKAILEILAKIERETGWGTKWRAEDLKEFWG